MTDRPTDRPIYPPIYLSVVWQVLASKIYNRIVLPVLVGRISTLRTIHSLVIIGIDGLQWTSAYRTRIALEQLSESVVVHHSKASLSLSLSLSQWPVILIHAQAMVSDSLRESCGGMASVESCLRFESRPCTQRNCPRPRSM
jgi:hypothetical protein